MWKIQNLIKAVCVRSGSLLFFCVPFKCLKPFAFKLSFENACQSLTFATARWRECPQEAFLGKEAKNEKKKSRGCANTQRGGRGASCCSEDGNQLEWTKLYRSVHLEEVLYICTGYQSCRVVDNLQGKCRRIFQCTGAQALLCVTRLPRTTL